MKDDNQGGGNEGTTSTQTSQETHRDGSVTIVKTET
jgi:hypothetical protein